MAQKINPISFRLGIKNNWSSILSEENKHYTSLLYQDLENKHYTKILLQSMGVACNGFRSKKNNKTAFLYTKNITRRTFNSNMINAFRRIKKLREKIINSKLLSGMNISGYVLNVHSKILKRPFWFSRKAGVAMFSHISACVFSSYFAAQVALSSKMRDRTFKVGLQRGILLTLRRYFKGKNKLFISGIRVSLAGKWSKTRSGRKQKLVVTIGKLNTQTINSFIDYDFQTVATRFGACSIKVLISYKNTKKRF